MKLTPEDVCRMWEALGGEGPLTAPALVARCEEVGRMLRVARPPTVRCTGVFARWCPRCGDCTCPQREAGDPGEVTFEDDGCPLHAEASSHGEDADD